MNRVDAIKWHAEAIVEWTMLRLDLFSAVTHARCILTMLEAGVAERQAECAKKGHTVPCPMCRLGIEPPL